MARNSGTKQEEILAFLKSQIKLKGYPPSVREICDAVGLSSTSTVHGHLSRLEKKGLIRKDPTKPRAIEILDRNIKELVDIPIVGKVTAGVPILAVENIEDSFPIPVEYINSSNEMFMLKISGDSMIEAGIFDGDLVIIEKCDVAKNGDKVVALIEDSATIKTFYKEKDCIRLQPENSTMEPIIVDECKILGKLKGLFRTY